MGTTESNVDHAASGQTVAGDSGELTFTYAQGRFASEGKDWESPVVTNMAASVSADAGNVPAGSITNTGTNNTFTSTTESSLATLLSNQCPFVIKATIFEGNGKNAIRERHTFTGSVLRQLDQASALLNGINESGQYPAIALREALVNALEHRDYTYSGPTLINIFDSRLEIVSLGGLTDGLEINDLLNGVCQPRTPRLAELFAGPLRELRYRHSTHYGRLRAERGQSATARGPHFGGNGTAYPCIGRGRVLASDRCRCFRRAQHH